MWLVTEKGRPVCTCIRYSTIETKEAIRIGYNGFLFQHEYSGEGRGVGGILVHRTLHMVISESFIN